MKKCYKSCRPNKRQSSPYSPGGYVPKKGPPPMGVPNTLIVLGSELVGPFPIAGGYSSEIPIEISDEIPVEVPIEISIGIL